MQIIILSGVLKFVQGTPRLTETLQPTNAYGNAPPRLTSMLIHSPKSASLSVCWATTPRISQGAVLWNAYGT